MEQRKGPTNDILLFFIFLSFAASSLSTSDARSSRVFTPNKKSLLTPLKQRLGVLSPSDPYYYYTDSPLSMPPYEEIMGSPSPSSSESDPLNCIYPPPEFSSPPSELSPPSVPSPIFLFPAPPEYPPSPVFIFPTPPVKNPNPPEFSPPPESDLSPPDCDSLSPPNNAPSPPHYSLSPPIYELSPPENTPTTPDYSISPPNYSLSPPNYELSPPDYSLSPPNYAPSPPDYRPSPPWYVPGPPIYLPPVVYPPPAGGERNGLWCVAKPSVPEPIIQEAMNYACGSGADCQSILPNGSCFQPDSVISHASYAFNSYWQRTRTVGGTCDFGGAAMLVTKDPSFDGCQFITIMLQGVGGIG